jgi:hypothetical protein
MQQLIDQLTSTYDMSAEDATDIINMVKSYTPTSDANEAIAEDTHEDDAQEETEQEETANKPEAAAAPTAIAASASVAAAEAPAEENMFQKATHFVEDHLPGGMKEKAEEMLGGLGDKVKGLFS